MVIDHGENLTTPEIFAAGRLFLNIYQFLGTELLIQNSKCKKQKVFFSLYIELKIIQTEVIV